jgi:hypothetical protein
MTVHRHRPVRHRFLLAAALAALLLTLGCGGGFGDDSDNAGAFRKSIFGAEDADTTGR